MTPADERLAVLAAAFFPEAARPLLLRLSVPEAQGVVERGAALASRSRSDRLGAVAASLAGTGRQEAADAALAALACERPVLARALRSLLPGAGEEGPGPRPHPLLVRAWREAILAAPPGRGAAASAVAGLPGDPSPPGVRRPAAWHAP